VSSFAFILFFPIKIETKKMGLLGIRSLTAEGARGRKRAGDGVEFEASIKLSLVAIRSDLGILLAVDFKGDEFMCAVFWVHNDQRLSAEDVLLGGPSII
jgi:hypothetical protein